jgi:hypothetical protein
MDSNPTSLPPMDPTAQRLVARARGIVPQGQALDTSHIFLEALLLGSGSPLAGEFEESVRERMNGALFSRIHNFEPMQTPDGFTPRLRTIFATAEQVARANNVPLTDTVLLSAILENDPVVEEVLLYTRAIDKQILVSKLRALIDMSRPDTSNDATLDLSRHSWIEQPNRAHSMKGCHTLLVAQTLNILATLDITEIAVVSGHNGSPIDQIIQTLTDLIASGSKVTGGPTRPFTYHHVRYVNVNSLRHIRTHAGRPSAYELLENAMHLSIREQSLLVLDSLETLEPGKENDDALIELLSAPGKALILGVYTRDENEAIDMEKVGLANTRHIDARPYNREQTLELLRSYFIPIWEQELNYTFEANAFDSIIALEPGAWIDSCRKVLPYLAVSLGKDAIDIADRNIIRPTAEAALVALDQLYEREWSTAMPPVRHQFEALLNDVRADIEHLITNPQPRLNDRKQSVLTRAHVVAQLICSNNSEFHLPGYKPAQ